MLRFLYLIYSLKIISVGMYRALWFHRKYSPLFSGSCSGGIRKVSEQYGDPRMISENTDFGPGHFWIQIFNQPGDRRAPSLKFLARFRLVAVIHLNKPLLGLDR